jgi:yeast amino acid transporter
MFRSNKAAEDHDPYASYDNGGDGAHGGLSDVEAVGGRSVVDPDSGVKRGLKNRHLSMMALAGIIGPGLLVGSGGALNSGGPAALIIGFGVIGTGPPRLGFCLRGFFAFCDPRR